MSRERSNISKRKIRKISRKIDESDDQIDMDKNAQKGNGLSPNTKLYYTKVITGTLTGLFSGIIFVLFDGASTDMWFLFLIIGLTISGAVFRLYLKVTPEELDFKRLLFSGTFTFTLLFIVLSSLIWMLQGPQY
ncbi:MAG: hypothetical protein ACTSR4_01710 [Candidatus Hodarchaeales archaeon]